MTSGSQPTRGDASGVIEPELLKDGHLDLGVLGVAAWITDVGHLRERNEDRLFVRELWSGSHLMLMVADGAGGHERGDQAAEQVVLTFSESASSAGSPPTVGMVEWLVATISEAHERVLGLAEGESRPPASTVVGLLIETSSLCAWRFHVGDSRVYSREPEGMVSQLTRDHNIANGLIDRGLAVSQAMKVAEGARLTQVLGGGVEQEPEIHGPLQLHPGQSVLIASDGAFGHNGGREVLLPAMRSGDLSVVDRAANLKRAILDGEAPDNLTAVLWEVPAGLVATQSRDTVTNSMKKISDQDITRRVPVQGPEEDDFEEEEEPRLLSSAGLVAFLLVLFVVLSVARLHSVHHEELTEQPSAESTTQSATDEAQQPANDEPQEQAPPEQPGSE